MLLVNQGLVSFLKDQRVNILHFASQAKQEHHLRSFSKKKLIDEIKIQQLSSSHCDKLLGKTDFSVVGLKLCLIQVKN